MGGEDGFLHSRYGLFLSALFASGILLFYHFREVDNGILMEVDSSELRLSGKQFRTEVETDFMAMSKIKAQRTYGLTDVCKKYFSVGMPFPDIETIMLAAGTRPSPHGMILVPDYNRNLPIDSPDRNDMGSGFVLGESWVSNAMFEIIFRPKDVSEVPKKIGAVMWCFVRVTNL